MEHKKHHGHHEGVRHEGAKEKNSWHGDMAPKSGNRQPKRMPGESGNGPSHMSWGGGEHHKGHHYKK